MIKLYDFGLLIALLMVSIMTVHSHQQKAQMDHFCPAHQNDAVCIEYYNDLAKSQNEMSRIQSDDERKTQLLYSKKD